MKTKKLILLAMVLFILITIYILIEIIKPFEKTSHIFEISADNIQCIELKNENDSLKFVKELEGWQMEESALYDIYEDQVENLVNHLVNLEATPVNNVTDNHYKSYGFEKIVFTIVFHVNSNESYNLIVGNKTPDKKAYYVYEPSTDQVYIVNDVWINDFKKSALSFRKKELFSIKSETLQEIHCMQQDGISYNLIKNDKGIWSFIEPISVDAKNEVINDIMNRLTKLKVKTFVDDKVSDYSIYGLASPRSSITLIDNTGLEQSIYLGKNNEDNQDAYVKTLEYGSVSTIWINGFNPNELSINNLLNFAPLSVSVEEISAVNLAIDESNYRFLLKHEDKNLYCDINGLQANSEDFITLYLNMMTLSAEGFDNEVTGTGTEHLFIELIKMNGEPINLSFATRDSTSHYMVLDGQLTAFYTSDYKVTLVKKWAERIFNEANK